MNREIDILGIEGVGSLGRPTSLVGDIVVVAGELEAIDRIRTCRQRDQIPHPLTEMVTSPTTRDVGRPRGPRSRISSETSPPIPIHDSDLCAIYTAGTNPSTSSTPFDRLLSDPPPEPRIAHESSCRVPYEIAEMIIAHLVRDLGALKTCSLTCRSWYFTTVPHLHHTLTLKGGGPDVTHGELKPLSKLRELSLAPFVKQIRVQSWEAGWFGPLAFSCIDQCNLSAFANVHTLELQNVEIYRFMPVVECYFGHFSQILRSITLHNPHCTPRQLSHFLSLFTNLDDIEIRNTHTFIFHETIPGRDLIPFSAPKLRGRLVLRDFNWVETWTHLITSCGGLRFRQMDLRGSVSCIPVLLGACAETLETLRFSMAGKWFSTGLPTDSS